MKHENKRITSLPIILEVITITVPHDKNYPSESAQLYSSMFRRLADKVNSAVASVASTAAGITNNQNNHNDDKVENLISLGFSRPSVLQALEITDGNVEQAAEWLFVNGNSSNSNNTAAPPAAAAREDEELQRAITASLQPAQPPRTTHKTPPLKSAAATKAGQAALARNTATTNAKVPAPAPSSVSHPHVKVPKKLQQHATQTVILRCAQRIAPHATAVDTLLQALQQLRLDPSNPKFKTMDTSSKAFQSKLQVPGVVDFLQAMGYHPAPTSSANHHHKLELLYVDLTTLYLGISALEQVQAESSEYKESKTLLDFEAEIQALLNENNPTAEELQQRQVHRKKLPMEPKGGAGSLTMEVGQHHKWQRKFDGDDTLEDVLNFLASHATALPQKLQSQEWYLVNLNYAPPIAYDVQALHTKTLQYMGCWPSGRLAIVPTKPPDAPTTHTSSRGLGGAPVSLLKL